MIEICFRYIFGFGCGCIVIYVVLRLITKAVVKTYYEEKKDYESKKVIRNGEEKGTEGEN